MPSEKLKQSHNFHMGCHSKITLCEEQRQKKLHSSLRYQELYRLFHKTITPNRDWKDSEQF